ncbi:hypothetical protein CCR91_12130 [Thiorhodovibrio winogradskyi]|nr:hypothetical protein [Thiorhodovibrio winogradskyi]
MVKRASVYLRLFTAANNGAKQSTRLADLPENLLDGRGIGDTGDDPHVRAVVLAGQRQGLEQPR